MKTAKEMFEKLGYKIIKDDECLLIYADIFFQIEFLKIIKEVGCYYGKSGIGNSISVPILKAINQQYKELGWFEE